MTFRGNHAQHLKDAAACRRMHVVSHHKGPEPYAMDARSHVLDARMLRRMAYWPYPCRKTGAVLP